MVIEGLITVGNIAEFIIDVTYLTWPVASLGYTINLVQRSAASQERIAKMMREAEEADEAQAAIIPTNPINGNIRFENVNFRYPDSEHVVVRNVSFEIKAGQTAALVGRTGSGKSSLIQLIPRLFLPSSGKIYIDGIDYTELPLKYIRQNIGFVPQETFLFSDTIGENIAFGVETVEQHEIEEAAEKAQILENILDFDKKFNTFVGERGITLSGGQKQRTSIARALIRKPPILILDDSLSAVDTKTEDAILDYLRESMNKRTTIIVSHRISSVKEADVIFVLDDGAIIESGTHSQLLTKKGYYAGMYQKQLLEKELAEL